jgi:hypothetical protein
LSRKGEGNIGGIVKGEDVTGTSGVLDLRYATQWFGVNAGGPAGSMKVVSAKQALKARMARRPVGSRTG